MGSISYLSAGDREELEKKKGRESMNAIKIISLVMIILGVMGLELSSKIH